MRMMVVILCISLLAVAGAVCYAKTGIGIGIGIGSGTTEVVPDTDSCLKLVNDTDTLLLVDDSTCLGLEN